MSIVLALAAAATPAQKPEDLVQLRDTMRCVATRAPRATSETLDSDFREQPAYARKLQRLMDTNKTCFSASTMRARGVIVPGFLAEAQLATMSVTMTSDDRIITHSRDCDWRCDGMRARARRAGPAG